MVEYWLLKLMIDSIYNESLNVWWIRYMMLQFETTEYCNTYDWTKIRFQFCTTLPAFKFVFQVNLQVILLDVVVKKKSLIENVLEGRRDMHIMLFELPIMLCSDSQHHTNYAYHSVPVMNYYY